MQLALAPRKSRGPSASSIKGAISARCVHAELMRITSLDPVIAPPQVLREPAREGRGLVQNVAERRPPFVKNAMSHKLTD